MKRLQSLASQSNLKIKSFTPGQGLRVLRFSANTNTSGLAPNTSYSGCATATPHRPKISSAYQRSRRHQDIR